MISLLCAATILTVPDVDTSFKAYMDWQCITNVRSEQYKLQQEAITDENGLRVYDGCYMIALGTYYGTVGDRFKITLDTGIEFEAIMGDVKDNRHTDETNRYVPSNGNLIEFIVETDDLPRLARRMGDVSYVDEFLEGCVEKIERIDS